MHPAEFNMQHFYVFGPTGSGDFVPRFSYHETLHVAILGLRSGTQPNIVGHRISNIGLLNGTEEDAIDGGRVRTGTFSSSSDDLNAIYNASMYQFHSMALAHIYGQTLWNTQVWAARVFHYGSASTPLHRLC
jgi:hypothetical protein